MQSEGWIFLCVSWLIILGLFAFSMMRTLRKKNESAQ
jgi:preprotein translocase subunit YajC